MGTDAKARTRKISNGVCLSRVRADALKKIGSSNGASDVRSCLPVVRIWFSGGSAPPWFEARTDTVWAAAQAPGVKMQSLHLACSFPVRRMGLGVPRSTSQHADHRREVWARPDVYVWLGQPPMRVRRYNAVRVPECSLVQAP